MITLPREDANFFEINCDKKDKINVITDKPLEDEFFLYAKNFKEAAYIISIDALNSNDIGTLDINFFSLAFMYRHSLELMLKAIGFQYIRNVEDRKKFLKETQHNLDQIFKYISVYIEECIDLDREAYEWIVEIFNDMNEIDKESDSFRYPFSIIINTTEDLFEGKQKSYSIKEFFDKQTHIDLIKFANKMETIFDILKNYYLKNNEINKDYKEFSPVFLEEGGYYYAQSVIGYGYNRNSFYCNIESYTNGAKILYKHINNNLHKKDELFMPLCYLYRNSTELAMKGILFNESSYKFEDTLKLLNRNKHKLLSIWNTIKDDIIIHCNVTKDDQVINNLEQYISKLNDIDGAADKFRYPIDKHLNPHFKRTKSFDINNVMEYFEEILSFFEGVTYMMSEQNQALRDLENEYRDEYY